MSHDPSRRSIAVANVVDSHARSTVRLGYDGLYRRLGRGAGRLGAGPVPSQRQCPSDSSAAFDLFTGRTSTGSEAPTLACPMGPSVSKP